MKLLYYLADMFINTFGITQPDAAGRKKAAFFILGLMVLLIVGVTAVGVLLHSVMR
jgi:hypothetical protein